MNKSSPFKNSVINKVKKIPFGKVASYGQVALAIGSPRAARQVGWILRGLNGSEPVPWWRVVNNEGRISIKGSHYSAIEQKSMLEKEGVKVGEDLTFQIESYRYVFGSNSNPNTQNNSKLEMGKQK